ncbi:MAG: TMEM175 family protein [Bacteroidota bacterium]
MNNLFSKSRVETFSDGIFAIIITLLVLEIKVPHISDPDSAKELSASIVALLPKIIGWIISFFTIAVIWVNHHRLFKQYKHLDNGIFWWNAVLLLWTSFIPFPTAVIGDYPGNRGSVVLYGLVMSLMAASFSLMRYYVLRKPELLDETVDVAAFRLGTKMSVVFGPAMYILGILAGFIHPYISFAIYLGIPIYFIFSENSNKK